MSIDNNKVKGVEQKKVEELLRQTQLIVENSQDAIIGETLDGIITSWNGGATKMFGYTADEVIGKSVLFLIPSERKDELPTLMNKIKAGEIIADYDSVRLRKDGSKIDIAFSGSPIKMEDGTVIGASVVERDIVRRKWYEDRVQRMTRLYSALSKCNKAIVHTTNEDELFQQICAAAVQSGGMMMAWVGLVDRISKRVKPVASFGKDKEYLDDIQISINANDPFGNGPTGISIRENHPVWCQDFENDPMMAPWHERTKNYGWRASAALPLVRKGNVVGSFTLYSDIVNAFDDDAQKLLIEMAVDISFALDKFDEETKFIKSKELLLQIQTVVENSYDAIIGETLDGIITSWNGGATKMFGYTADEAIGKSVLFLLPPEMKDEVPTLLNKIKAREVVADYDSVMLRKDGSRIDVAFSGSPIQKEDGTVIGASVVERDITIRKKAERHIKELNEVRSKFIDIISHQLRTPLTAVNWNLEMLLKGDFGKLEETQRKFLHVTYASSIEITNRIHSLLTAIDIEEGRIRYITEEVAIESIVAAITNELTKKAELKNISYEYISPEKELPVIEGDGEKIRMIISTLIDNAITYTKENGKIKASLKLSGDMVRFEIIDTGIGIPKEEQRHVFNRFFRASNSSIMQPDAFGLGLFIAKNFIDQHHGKIGYESKEAVGSTFWFEIPIKNGAKK